MEACLSTLEKENEKENARNQRGSGTVYSDVAMSWTEPPSQGYREEFLPSSRAKRQGESGMAMET